MFTNLQTLFDTVQDTEDSVLAVALYLWLPEYDLPDDAKEDITSDELRKAIEFITLAEYQINSRHLWVTSPDEGSQYDYEHKDFLDAKEVNGTVYDIIKWDLYHEKDEIGCLIPTINDRFLLTQCLLHLTRCHRLLEEVWQSQHDIYGQANDFFKMVDDLNDKELDEIVSSNI